MDAGVDESIMLDMDGHVTEARGANVFAVKDGTLYTPGEGILHGITRLAVLEIAQDNDIETVATAMTPYDFYNADEAFFASTAGGVMPIVQVDGRQVGDGCVGPREPADKGRLLGAPRQRTVVDAGLSLKKGRLPN